MRSLLLVFFIVSSQLFQAQNFVPIDTSDINYRKNLKALYSQRVSQQEQVFKKELSNSKIRKEVNSIYEEATAGFLETIGEGYFVEDTLYRNQLNEILETLKSN